MPFRQVVTSHVEAVVPLDPNLCGLSDVLNERIERAILETLPDRIGHRHEQVFAFCRRLKGIPQIRDAEGRELLEYVHRWHRAALPHISTKPIEETEIDFLRGWPRVKFASGEEPMAVVFEAALSQPYPLPECAQWYEQDEIRTLIALCRELQRGAGDGPFYLACRTAGGLFQVSYSTASRWLFLLTNDEVLEVVEKGSNETKRATRYRYLGPM
jgi:hypothetical protein